MGKETELDRLDDRYVTTKSLLAAGSAVVSLVLGFVVWTFMSISDQKTENALMRQDLVAVKEELASSKETQLKILNILNDRQNDPIENTLNEVEKVVKEMQRVLNKKKNKLLEQ